MSDFARATTGPFNPPQTLEDLRDLLRDRSRWPEGFEWKFDDCSHCAMGLFFVARGENTSGVLDSIERLRKLAPHDTVWKIFVHDRREEEEQEASPLQPEDIADRIDVYLSTLRLPEASIEDVKNGGVRRGARIE